MRENESDGAGGWWQPPEDASRRPRAKRARGRAGPARTRLPRRRATIRTPSPSARRRVPPGIGRPRKPGRLRPGLVREPGRLPRPGRVRARAATEARAATGQGGYPGQGGGGATRLADARSPAGAAFPAGRAAAGLRGRRRARGGHRRRGDRRVRRPPRAPRRPGSPPATSPGRTTTRRAAEPPRRRSTRPRCGRRWIRAWSTSCRTSSINGETAEGTGMIMSASGLVLTNNHVIDGATSVRVNLATVSRPVLHGQGRRL